MKKSKLKAEIKILKLRQENMIYELAQIKSAVARIEEAVRRNSDGDTVFKRYPEAALPLNPSYKEVTVDAKDLAEQISSAVMERLGFNLANSGKGRKGPLNSRY
jgi:hypothetical protein